MGCDVKPPVEAAAAAATESMGCVSPGRPGTHGPPGRAGSTEYIRLLADAALWIMLLLRLAPALSHFGQSSSKTREGRRWRWKGIGKSERRNEQKRKEEKREGDI